MNDWFGGVSFSRLEWDGAEWVGVVWRWMDWVDWFELSCVTVREEGVLESLLAFCRVCAISWAGKTLKISCHPCSFFETTVNKQLFVND